MFTLIYCSLSEKTYLSHSNRQTELNKNYEKQNKGNFAVEREKYV